MAKTSFVCIFALVLIISVHIHTVFGHDQDKDMMDKAGDAASSAKHAAEDLGHKASNVAQNAKDTGASLADWFKGKFSFDASVGDDDQDHSKTPSKP